MTDVRETTMFKPVPEGYVYRAPSKWVFGGNRFYLVNETQKAEILAIARARSQAPFWLTLTGLVAASSVIVAWASGHGGPTVRDAVITLAVLPVCFYAALVLTIWPLERRLAPILARLPRTDQRITPADLRAAMRTGLSFRKSLLLGLVQGILACGLAVSAMLLSDDATPSGQAVALLLMVASAGGMISAICLLAVAVGKRRGERR